MTPIAADRLDLAAFIRPGDRIVCGQARSEPLSLTQALVAQQAAIGPVEVFLGATYSDTFKPDLAPGIRFSAYGGIGAAAALAQAGRVDILPMQYGALNHAFATGVQRADVVMLLLSPGRGYSLSLGNDYAVLAARHARTVLAEINPDAPWTFGAELPHDIVPDLLVAASGPPFEARTQTVGETERLIGAHVAELVADGACLQLGVGGIPDAILAALGTHRDIGIHSGVILDRIVDLIEAGVITNARKSVDPGITVTNIVLGSHRLDRHIHDNTAVEVRPASHTHGLDVLSRIANLVAVNSAVEVDLSGQVNAELADGRFVGGVGGILDFVRGANASPGGRAIIALPATARGGAVSRIVPQLTTVTVPRSDVDVIVTEFGRAELRGCSLAERARRLTAIAAPAFRDDLERKARALPWTRLGQRP